MLFVPADSGYAKARVWIYRPLPSICLHSLLGLNQLLGRNVSGIVFRGKGLSSVMSMDVDLSDMVDRWRLRGGCGTQGRPS